MKTTTGKSIRLLQGAGCTVGTVEKWNGFIKRRQDLWGCDLLAFNEFGTLLIQCTTIGNMAARVKKLRSMPEVQRWIDGNIEVRRQVWVHGWRKRKVKGRLKWTCKAIRLLADGTLFKVEL